MRVESLIGHTQELLGSILNSTLPADSIIDSFFRSHKYLGASDRRFVAGVTYGVLRHLRKCDIAIKSAIPEYYLKINSEDKLLLQILAYLSFEKKLNEVKPEFLLSKINNSYVKENLQQFIRNINSDLKLNEYPFSQKIAIEYSYPDWMVEKFIEEYGEGETTKICSSMNEQAPLTIRVNTIKTSIEKCQTELEKEGYKTTRTLLSPFGLNFEKRINAFSLQTFRNGWFEVQDEGSQLLPIIIDPKPNSKIIDVCAGAGGKTLEFAALMKNRGEIFATDINEFRLRELHKRVKRAGAQNIRINKINSIDELVVKFKDYFNIVFVDAPCSGLGTIRRNPGMKWLVSQQTIDEVSQKQLTILEASSKLVKPSGQLIYATCTILKQENEKVIETFLDKHSEFSLNRKENAILDNIAGDEKGFIKLLPHKHNTDGFFCAFLRKK